MMTMQIFWSYLLTILMSAAAIPFVKKAADALDIVAKENHRTVHKGRIARIGGLAIFISFMIGSAIFLKADRQTNAMLVGAFLVFSVGFFDDIYDLSPKKKLLVELIASTIVIFYGGISLKGLSIPFFPEIKTGILSIIITYGWIIGITNAINLIDGLDGLCAGVSTIVLVIIAFTSLEFFRSDIAMICFLLAGAICGFLIYNFHPASIFMGDCGALFIGFMISTVSLLGFGYKSRTFFTLGAPIVMLAIPIMDTFMAIIRRKLKGMKFSDADREHLHHTLMIKLEMGQTRTVIILYMVTVLFGMSAYLYTYNKKLGLILFLLLVLAFELFIEYTGMISVHYKPILAVFNLFLSNPNLPTFAIHRKKMEARMLVESQLEQSELIEKEKERIKMKNKRTKNIIVAIIVLLALGAIGLSAYYYNQSKQPDSEPEVVEEVKPSYVKGNNETELMTKTYEDLLAAVEANDENKIIGNVASYFAVDFFTWSNKSGREDIGGIKYVLEDARIDFAKYATNYYYVNFDEHKSTYGQEGLPEVSSVTVNSVEKSSFVYNKTNNDQSYDVSLTIAYKPITNGLPTDNLMKDFKVTVLKVEDLFYVVGVDYTNVTEKVVQDTYDWEL